MLPLERNEDVKRKFSRQGYVAIRGFLTPDEVRELRGEIDRYLAEVVPGIPPRDVYFETPGDPDSIKQLMRMSQYDAYFGRLLASERFVGLAELLLDGPVISRNIQWFNKPAGAGRATPPHQDGYYLMLEPNEAITMWLALEDVSEDNGCMRYVSGSHLDGLRPHQRTDTLGFSQGIPDYGAEDRAHEQAVPARPGDLLVHHSLTIHRADANLSDRKRRALGLLYYSASAKEDTKRLREYTRALETDLSRRAAG